MNALILSNNSINNSVSAHPPPIEVSGKIGRSNGADSSPDSGLDPETLRSYTKAKLPLAAQLRILREALKQRCSQSRFQATVLTVDTSGPPSSWVGAQAM